MRGPDDPLSDVGSRPTSALRDTMGGSRRNPSAKRELVGTLSNRDQVLVELHGACVPQKRGHVNPATGGVVLTGRFAHPSPMGSPTDTYADVLFRTLFELIQKDGQAHTLRRAGIAQGTFDHWQKARAAGRQPGLNRGNFEALCRLPEVRAALATALLRRPDAQATAWEAISGELSRLMDPSTGWALVAKLAAMKELELLDGGLSALEGAITARRRAAAENAKHAKLSDSKAKQKI